MIENAPDGPIRSNLLEEKNVVRVLEWYVAEKEFRNSMGVGERDTESSEMLSGGYYYVRAPERYSVTLYNYRRTIHIIITLEHVRFFLIFASTLSKSKYVSRQWPGFFLYIFCYFGLRNVTLRISNSTFVTRSQVYIFLFIILFLILFEYCCIIVLKTSTHWFLKRPLFGVRNSFLHTPREYRGNILFEYSDSTGVEPFDDYTWLDYPPARVQHCIVK
jgi:hypothetical protein